MLPRLVAALLATSLLAACGPREGDARKYLEQQGYAVSELKRAGGGFEFTGTKGDDLCTGTLRLKDAATAESLTKDCAIDVRACKAGSSDDCSKLADKVLEKKDKGAQAKAGDLLRVACADRNARACARIAVMESGSQQWLRVREFAGKACELGDGESCTRLAMIEYAGKGGPKNETKARELMQEACSLSFVQGCRDAAGMLLDGSKDPAGAVPFAEKACEAKFVDSCAVLGMALYRAKQRLPEAFAHLRAACEDAVIPKRGTFCNVAGAILFQGGEGVARDMPAGVALFEKACGRDDVDGCTAAADALANGTGVARDKKRAATLYARACALGNKEACSVK